MAREHDGYGADIPYLRDFKPMLAPAWLDHVALLAGVEPPARQNGFAWCDLGCGQGVTAAILAATHPAGVFHGIDAMPEHIDHARRLAVDATIPNLQFHAADFAAAIDLELPQFDYIVVHGVYTWISREAQQAVRRFCECRLKPGGLVYLGYNTMPGWACDLPFQGLLRELGRTLPGDNFARFTAAAALARNLASAGAQSLAASFMIKELRERSEDYSPAYLVHEFMPAAWQPLYVTEVRRDMAEIGFEPIGSATLSENFDWMVLHQTARRMLATITEPDARELVRDYYLDQRFRRDVFARENRRLGPEERGERLLSSTFMLARPVPEIRYTTTTPAGSFAYDSPAARAIIAALAAGRPAGAKYLDAFLTLCAAGDVIPAEPGRRSVANLNRVLCARVDGAEEIRWLALPCGTAVEVDPGLLRALRDGRSIDDDRFPGWRHFLHSHGL
jgi:SAM-dependent methyltransferase